MGQDYEVIDIDCSLGENSVSQEEFLHARLRKPEKFKGVPLFADDRKKDPLTDPECSIIPDPLDPQGLTYNLKISDLNECGVILKDVSLKHNNISFESDFNWIFVKVVNHRQTYKWDPYVWALGTWNGREDVFVPRS